MRKALVAQTVADSLAALNARTVTPQINLAAMLSALADEIALGKFGDAAECVVFVRGPTAAAIVTLPQEPIEDTAARLDVAKHFLLTGELLT